MDGVVVADADTADASMAWGFGGVSGVGCVLDKGGL